MSDARRCDSASLWLPPNNPGTLKYQRPSARSADRALGRWYFKVPGLFGGDRKKSEAHLRKSLTYNPNSTASLYFLAETLIELDRDVEARETLQKVLDAPLDPDWTPEDKEFKQQATALLKTLR